jgi:hypothetical protein
MAKKTQPKKSLKQKFDKAYVEMKDKDAKQRKKEADCKCGGKGCEKCDCGG